MKQTSKTVIFSILNLILFWSGQQAGGDQTQMTRWMPDNTQATYIGLRETFNL